MFRLLALLLASGLALPSPAYALRIQAGLESEAKSDLEEKLREFTENPAASVTRFARTLGLTPAFQLPSTPTPPPAAGLEEDAPIRILFADQPHRETEADEIRELIRSMGLESKVELLQERGEAGDQQKLKGLIEKYDPTLVIVSSGKKTFVDPYVVHAASRHGVRLIIRAGAGYENISVETTTRYGVPFLRSHGLGESMASFTLRFMFAGLRLQAGQQLGAGETDVSEDQKLGAVFQVSPVDLHEALRQAMLRKRGEMTPDQKELIFGPLSMWEFSELTRSLSGKTIGILGFGVIGQEVARRLNEIRKLEKVSFDIVAVEPSLLDPTSDETDVAQRLDVRIVDEEELSQTSDIVTIHIPSTDGNRNYITPQSFAGRTKPLILVNTARWDLVDNVLFETEQPFDLTFFGDVDFDPKVLALRAAHPKTFFVTPHMGGLTKGSAQGAIKNLLETLKIAIPVLLGEGDPGSIRTINGVQIVPIISGPDEEDKKSAGLEEGKFSARDVPGAAVGSLDRLGGTPQPAAEQMPHRSTRFPYPPPLGFQIPNRHDRSDVQDQSYQEYPRPEGSPDKGSKYKTPEDYRGRVGDQPDQVLPTLSGQQGISTHLTSKFSTPLPSAQYTVSPAAGLEEKGSKEFLEKIYAARSEGPTDANLEVIKAALKSSSLKKQSAASVTVGRWLRKPSWVVRLTENSEPLLEALTEVFRNPDADRSNLERVYRLFLSLAVGYPGFRSALGNAKLKLERYSEERFLGWRKELVQDMLSELDKLGIQTRVGALKDYLASFKEGQTVWVRVLVHQFPNHTEGEVERELMEMGWAKGMDRDDSDPILGTRYYRKSAAGMEEIPSSMVEFLKVYGGQLTPEQLAEARRWMSQGFDPIATTRANLDEAFTLYADQGLAAVAARKKEEHPDDPGIQSVDIPKENLRDRPRLTQNFPGPGLIAADPEVGEFIWPRGIELQVRIVSIRVEQMQQLHPYGWKALSLNRNLQVEDLLNREILAMTVITRQGERITFLFA